jgi:hypothetical protein
MRERTAFPVRSSARIAVSLLIGVLSFVFVYLIQQGSAGSGDFWRPFAGAQALMARTTPYPWFGGARFPHEFPDLYPLVASVPLLPLTVFPFAIAAATFSGISSGLLAFAFMSTGYHRLVGFVSFPLIIATHSSQMAVIMTAAFIMPALSFFYIAKPTIGAALLAARGSVRAVVIALGGGLLLLITSLVLSPGWIPEWLAVVRANSGHMKPPILHPGGFVALLALLRWKRPEARMIVAVSMVPQNVAWYDSVPLLMLPTSLIQAVLQSFLISVPAISEVLRGGGGDHVVDFWPKGYQLALFAYLPAVILVLQRPNEGRHDESLIGAGK